MRSALAARSGSLARSRGWLAGCRVWAASSCGWIRLASSCASVGGALRASAFGLISHLGPRVFLLVSFFLWFSFPRCTGRDFRRLVLQEVLVLAN